ncbi:HSP20-like chaperone [Gautieria morchelliformis]|nr:HSP20-like chaperone [Gautieria morchelliformis]
MSITRNLFKEVRPFFRLFDEVARAPPAYSLLNRPFGPQFDPILEPRRPSIDLSEKGDEYIVEAEVPGVKKENLNVRVGDGGRSITVEGRIFTRSPSESESSNTSGSVENSGSASNQTDTQGENKVAKSEDPLTQLSVEREFVGSAQFTRTVWLPRPVDASKVAGKLSDGILTLRVPKAEEKDSVTVDIQ